MVVTFTHQSWKRWDWYIVHVSTLYSILIQKVNLLVTHDLLTWPYKSQNHTLSCGGGGESGKLSYIIIWSLWNFGRMNLIGWWMHNYISAYKAMCSCNNNMANLIDGPAIDTRIGVAIICLDILQRILSNWKAVMKGIEVFSFIIQGSGTVEVPLLWYSAFIGEFCTWKSQR